MEVCQRTGWKLQTGIEAFEEHIYYLSTMSNITLKEGLIAQNQFMAGQSRSNPKDIVFAKLLAISDASLLASIITL